MSQKYFCKIHTSGFTLVELIVVITILAILGTIGFVQLGGFAGSARDSVRISSLTNLKKGLDMFQIKSWVYPLPENPVNITASGTIIGYQGFAKEQVGNMAKLSPGGTVDPLDPTMFTTYSVSGDKTKMQAMVFLEDSSTLTTFHLPLPMGEGWGEGFITKTHASTTSDYSRRFPTTTGDNLGILLGNSGSTLNQPVQELYNTNSFTGVDVVNTNSGYLAVFGNKDSLVGTGNVLSVISSMGAKSCNDLLLKDGSKKNKDGSYYINPTMSSSSNGTFQVYCDMTTDGGGWTLVWKVWSGAVINNASYTGASDDISSLQTSSYHDGLYAKLSDTIINILKSKTLAWWTPVYRLEENVANNNKISYWQWSCVFWNGWGTPPPDCRIVSLNYTNPIWLKNSYQWDPGWCDQWWSTWQSSVFCATDSVSFNATLHFHPSYQNSLHHTTKMTKVFVK